MGCQYMVELKDAKSYLDFVTANYEDSIAEGHITRYGNLDRLKPIGYTPNFTIPSATGLVPDMADQQVRSVIWQISPRKICIHVFYRIVCCIKWRHAS
jgi:hypothetical protein